MKQKSNGAWLIALIVFMLCFTQVSSIAIILFYK